MGTSKKCHERAKCKADGAEKPECPDLSGHEDFDPDKVGITQQFGRAISF